jgi:hypothetical protein
MIKHPMINLSGSWSRIQDRPEVDQGSHVQNLRQATCYARTHVQKEKDMHGRSDNKPIQIRALSLEQRALLFSVAEATGTDLSKVTQKFWSWWLGEEGAELPLRPSVVHDPSYIDWPWDTDHCQPFEV